MRSILRVLVLTIRGAVLLPVGLMSYWRTGRTPEYAHQAIAGIRRERAVEHHEAVLAQPANQLAQLLAC